MKIFAGSPISLWGPKLPMFSPDGKHIVFAAYLEEDNNDVFAMTADGSDLKQLTHSPGYDGHPYWSVDGSRIVFNSDRSFPDPDAPWNQRWHEIYSMNADGNEIRQRGGTPAANPYAHTAAFPRMARPCCTAR